MLSSKKKKKNVIGKLKNRSGENTCDGAHKWHLRRTHRWLRNKYNLHCVRAYFTRYPQEKERTCQEKVWQQQPRPCPAYKLADCWCLLNRQPSLSGAQLHFTELPFNGLKCLHCCLGRWGWDFSLMSIPKETTKKTSQARFLTPTLRVALIERVELAYMLLT